MKNNEIETRYLFPHSFKKVGWIVLIPSALIGLLMIFEKFPLGIVLDIPIFDLSGAEGFFNKATLSWEKNNLMDELVCILTIIGALFAACSREKIEDEYIAKLRLESLLWATYINFGILILAVLLIYGFSFIKVMQFNLVTLLIIFLVRFNYILIRNAKLSRHEK